MVFRFLLTGLVTGIVTLLGLSHSMAHPRISTALTWRADIRPILKQRCMSCHRAGGIAPMSLETYEEARPWARAIREEVLERRMPPSGLRSGAGLYENARTLSLGEMELLAAWVDGGAPSGEEPGSTAMSVPTVPEESPPLEWDFTISGKASAGDAPALTHRVTFAVPAGWIGAWTLDAGGLPARSARLSLADGTLLGTWTPDEPPVQYPEGTGVRIERASDVTADFQLAFAADEAEREAATPQLRARARRDARQRIVRKTLRGASTPAAAGETLLALRLELEDPNASAEVVVERKNGDHEFLLAMAPPGVPDPISYRLRKPLVLNAGDSIRVNSTAAFALDLEEFQAARPARSGRR